MKSAFKKRYVDQKKKTPQISGVPKQTIFTRKKYFIDKIYFKEENIIESLLPQNDYIVYSKVMTQDN